MLEDYINRIESIISPNHYSKENYKEKLQIDGSKIPKDYGAVQENEEEEEREEEENKNPEIEENQEQKEAPVDQEQKEASVDQEQKEAQTPKKTPQKAVKQPKGSAKKTKPITSSANKLKQKPSEEEAEEQSVASENQEFSRKTSGKEYSQSDIKQLLDKVHNLNKKNMNYRYDIEKLKTRIQILENEKKEQAEAIEKVEKQKSQLSQYLVRLEKTLNKQDNTMREFKPPVEKVESASTTFKKTLAKPRVTYGVNPPASTIKSMKKKNESNLDNSQLSEAKSTLSIFNSPTVEIDIGGSNTITIKDTTTNKSVTLRDKADQKNFLLKVAKENQKLKSFQSQVFELSKTYDDINDNLVSSMKNLEELFANKNKENAEQQQEQPEEGEEGEENQQPAEPATQQDVLDKFKELLVSAENVYNPPPEDEEEKKEEEKKENEEKKEGEEGEEQKELTPEEKLEASKEEITVKFQNFVKGVEDDLNAKNEDFQKKLLVQYQNLVENVEKTLQTKQEEYNKLLKTKDEQIDMMTNEITNLRSDIEARKKDRIKDLHIISTLEEDNKNLKDSLLKGDLEQPKGKNKDLLYNLNEGSMRTLKPKGGDSRVEPMKKMLGSIVEKIEANFDLNDRENIQMIETLHKTLK